MIENSMAGQTMAGFRCWSAENVAQTVYSDIGQLSGEADAVFLAAHSPMDLEHRKGKEDANGANSAEERVLEALTSRIGDVDRNTLVAVTGASGSGKSHVVRWVHAHLPKDDPRFQILYVPRAVQTLRELLRRIIEGLPGVEGTDLMRRVDSAFAGVKPGMLQENLFNQMKLALNWTLEDRAPYDGETSDEAGIREDRNAMLGDKQENGGRTDGLADLLDLPAFKEKLLRADSPLGRLVESYFEQTSWRSGGDSLFTEDDLPLKSPKIITELRGRSTELRDLWTIISSQPRDALVLLEEALRAAVPRALGLRDKGGETLDSLFRASRQALRAQGQELVLIFEDLAQFGLVDGELYDQFVTPPGDDLAPLRVIFAITDGPYGKMERTVRTRVEHEFHVSGSALAHSPDFIGRYLNLARVGREEAQSLWNSAVDRTSSRWMRNACDTREEGSPCRFRDVCHASFGSVNIEGLGDVGLYPYNNNALQRALVRVGDAATPRLVMDRLITTILDEADSRIAAGDYPHDRTKEQFDFKVRMGKDALLEKNPANDPERNYRALVIWGDESPLAPGIREAFSLGDSRDQSKPPERRDLSKPPESPFEVPKGRESAELDLPNLLAPLFQWQNGDDLPDADADVLRLALYDLTYDRLHLDQYRVHVLSDPGRTLLHSLFSKNSFTIEGARGRGAGGQSIRFHMERTVDDMRVMAAARWFHDHGHFEPTRAKWQWPEGYDPGELMVELETRLDLWADQVRWRFLQETGGSRLANWAVGLRALALAATGHDVERLGTVSAVLRNDGSVPIGPSTAWVAVDQAASATLNRVDASEYVGNFAAVRQGDRGRAQLVDPRGLDDAIHRFLTAPIDALGEVITLCADSTLRAAADRLLGVLHAAVLAEDELLRASAETVVNLLEGHTPAEIGAYAFSVADSAKDAGFFRPVAQWEQFRRHIDCLKAASPAAPPVTFEGDVAAVVRGQHAARETNRVAEALTFIQQCMDLTNQECKRSGGAGGDLATLRNTLAGQVEKLTDLVDSLGQGKQS